MGGHRRGRTDRKGPLSLLLVLLIAGVAAGVYLLRQGDAASAESPAPPTAAPAAQVQPLHLELSPLIIHGHIVEVKGKTDPGATVMINGQPVPAVRENGSFNYYTPPLPKGPFTVTVTAHDSQGQVKTVRRTVELD